METSSEEKQDDTKPSYSKRLKNFVGNITIEPYLLAYVIALSISLVAVQNLYIEKACRVKKKFAPSVCDNVMLQNQSESSYEEIEIQSAVSNMLAWKAPIEFTPAILVIIFGAWSDRIRRRKPFLLLPLLGEMACCTGLLLSAYFLLEWPMEVAGLCESIPTSFTGSTVTMMMANFAYITDISSPQQRTLRIGVLNVINTVSNPIGVSVGGILLKYLGYYGMFSIAIGIYLCGIAYLACVVKESNTDVEEKKSENDKEDKFSILHLLKQTLNVISKKRKGSKRKQLLVILLTYCVCNGPNFGSYSLFYLYLRRKFMFDEMKYGVYSMYSTFIEIPGMVGSLAFLSNKLRLSNCLIGTIGLICNIISKCIFGFAPNTKWLYVAPIPDSLQGLVAVSLRTISSEVVDDNERGKIFSLIGMMDAVLGLIFRPVMAIFYASTLETFPGAYFILQAITMAPALFIFLYIYKLQKMDEDISKSNPTGEIENMDEATELTSLNKTEVNEIEMSKLTN